MEKMHASMSTYVKSLSKRSEGEGKEKMIPIAYVGTTMARHGEVFEEGNKFGECLLSKTMVDPIGVVYLLTVAAYRCRPSE